MENTYTKEKGSFDSHSNDALLTTEEKPTIFHVGQSYADEPVCKITCLECGGDNFKVGQGSYFTAIKCVNCEWEAGIHDG